jgi:hypothetical protein
VLQYNSDPSLPPTALLDEEGNRFIVSSGAQIYRTYRGVVQRFASVDDLTLCFRYFINRMAPSITYIRYMMDHILIIIERPVMYFLNIKCQKPSKMHRIGARLL